MLQKEYVKLEDIPADKRGAYVPKDGKLVLDDLSEDHPVIVHKKELERDLTAEKAKATRATNEKTEALARALPDGHVAAPAADAAVLSELKATGVPLAEVKQRVTDFPGLKKRVEEHERAAHLAEVAKVMKWKPEALQAIADKLPELEIRDKTENGQVVKDENDRLVKIVIAKVKGANDAVEDKPFEAYFKETPTLNVFEPSLLAEPKAAEGGTELPEMGHTGGGGSKSLAGALIADRYMDEPPQKGAGAAS